MRNTNDDLCLELLLKYLTVEEVLAFINARDSVRMMAVSTQEIQTYVSNNTTIPVAE